MSRRTSSLQQQCCSPMAPPSTGTSPRMGAMSSTSQAAVALFTTSCLLRLDVLLTGLLAPSSIGKTCPTNSITRKLRPTHSYHPVPSSQPNPSHPTPPHPTPLTPPHPIHPNPPYPIPSRSIPCLPVCSYLIPSHLTTSAGGGLSPSQPSPAHLAQPTHLHTPSNPRRMPSVAPSTQTSTSHRCAIASSSGCH